MRLPDVARRPDLATEPIRAAYADVEWAWDSESQQALARWKKGATGFPLVDAGARSCENVACFLLAPFTR
jgi:deoxyribodipyrimidine photolyase